ncbi:MAG: DUF6973 domain-containing protein [Myxococcota bacterium]
MTSIARRHGTTVQALMQANPQITNPNRIRAGQQLNLPGWDGRNAFQPPAPRPPVVTTPTPTAGPPPRADLGNIERNYQQADDTLIDYRPQLGGLPVPTPFVDTYRITQTEGKLLDKLASQRGIAGQMAFRDIKDRAFDVSEARFPDPTPIPAGRDRQWLNNDGHRDAFRHAYWNALMTREFGASWTAQFATAHEGLPGNPSNREAMDLYNNEVGRQIALANPDATPEQLADLVQQAVNDGRLVVVPPSGSGLEWSDRVPRWGHGLTDGRVAGGGNPVPNGNASVR